MLSSNDPQSVLKLCMSPYPCFPTFLSFHAASSSLYRVPSSPKRTVLPLPDLHGLAEAAQALVPARPGALSAEAQTGARVRGSVPGCELCLPLVICPYGRVPGAQLLLQVLNRD